MIHINKLKFIDALTTLGVYTALYILYYRKLCPSTEQSGPTEVQEQEGSRDTHNIREGGYSKGDWA